jgi:hypothetical protein
MRMSEKPPPYRRPTLPWERAADPGLGWGAWASAGLEFGLAVVLFLLGGRWLDANLGWTPWGTVIGAMLGVVAGTYLLLRTALRGQLPPAKDSPPRKPGGDDAPPSAPGG